MSGGLGPWIKTASRRYKNFLVLAFLLSACGLCGSFFAQYVMKLTPCVMCIAQRVSMALTAALGVAAFFGGWSRRWVSAAYAALLSIPSGYGLVVAIQQLRLMAMPADRVPLCGPGFNMLWEKHPFLEFLQVVLRGDGDCAKPLYMLGAPIPVWSLLFFSLILLSVWGGFFIARFEKRVKP